MDVDTMLAVVADLLDDVSYWAEADNAFGEHSADYIEGIFKQMNSISDLYKEGQKQKGPDRYCANKHCPFKDHDDGRCHLRHCDYAGGEGYIPKQAH